MRFLVVFVKKLEKLLKALFSRIRAYFILIYYNMRGETMSDSQQEPNVDLVPKTPRKRRTSTKDTDALQKMLALDPTHKTFKKLAVAFVASTVIFIATVVAMGLFFSNAVQDMRDQYIRDTEQIIITKSELEASNAWERLPVNERKEKLRMQYYQIVRYYTNRSTEEQKMNDEMIQTSFNQLWDCIVRVPSVNFFLPVAYMRVASNYNPVYDFEYKHGLGAFFNKTGERISALKLVREDPAFQLEYTGVATLDMPTEAIKLLVARIDDLMITFNNRIDWVLLSLFTNEYDVIERYWDGGNGAIPDEFYKEGNLAEALEYFYAFRNWQIPRDADLEDDPDIQPAE